LSQISSALAIGLSIIEIRCQVAVLLDFKILDRPLFNLATKLSFMNAPSHSQSHTESVARYFTQTDQEARQKFLTCASAIAHAATDDLAVGALIESFAVPSKRVDSLFVDFAYFPARIRPRKLLVITSGLHGIEAPTGSALQLQFLTEIFPRLKRENLAVLLVHNLNPFGWRMSRRATEHNVNLNRNFGVSRDFYQTANPDYDRLAKVFEPQSDVTNPRLGWLKTLTMIARCQAFYGFTSQSLTHAIGHGQFKHPTGLEYGGQQPEPQTQFFIDTLKRFSREVEDIVLMDLHTGLGERHQLHLMPGDHSGCINSKLFTELIAPSQKDPYFVFTTANDKGFYKTCGDINSVVPQIAQPNQRVLALTMEFGTLGMSRSDKIESLSRVVLENQGFHCGYKSEATQARVASRFNDLFNPQEPKWRANALERGGRLLRDVAQRLDE
jgi:hypothetical protein